MTTMLSPSLVPYGARNGVLVLGGGYILTLVYFGYLFISLASFDGCNRTLVTSGGTRTWRSPRRSGMANMTRAGS